MDKADLLFLLDYSRWANQKLSETAALVSAEQFKAPMPATSGSLRGIMVHILVAHRVWLSRCRDRRMPNPLPAQAEFPDYASVHQSLRAEESAWHTYLTGLPEAGVQCSISYQISRGELFSNPVWQIVAHLVNHTTQHRSEAAEVLTQMGCSPGDLDLIWYLRRGA